LATQENFRATNMEFDLLTIIRGLAIAVFLSGLIWAGWNLSKPLP